ncbi:MAG: iron-containing alcohol dehydrogenase [Clostridiaceae bacterium]|nr:iron-containing alcohol dehydrogenase [Clostridiaceae bacterium]
MTDQCSLMMPKAVYSGSGALNKIRELTEGVYKKAAIFTDHGVKQAGLLELPVQFLREAGVETVVIGDLPAEPDCEEAEQVIEAFRRTEADLIVAVGGGSVMDVAKLASITADGSCSVRELLDDPGLGRKQVPTLMIPTTAGTGSEATMNSIVAVPEKQVKTGIVNPEMIPDYVILDGVLLKNLPKKIAASTGIDAMAHAVECYTSKKANPFSNLFAREAAKLIFNNIIEACEDTEAEEAKTNMLIAAFYAGVAISASGTTAVHALSYPLGGKYHIPHGVSNAMLLLPVMRFNKTECVKEFAELADAVTGGNMQMTDEEKADWLLQLMEEIIRRLKIPVSLTEFGIGRENLEELVESGMDVKRLLNNNKREIKPEDARRIYLEIMEERKESTCLQEAFIKGEDE